MKLSAFLLALFMVALCGCTANDIDSSVSQIADEPLLTSNNVIMDVSGMGYKDNKPYISATIRNKSDQHTIIYGQEFLILDGETKVNPKNDVVWESIAYILKGGDYNSQTFSLEDYDLKENTTYRLIKKYKIEGYDDNYSVYFDFKIDKSKIKGITLTKDSEVWTHKECVISDDIPIYLLGEDNTLYSKISMNSSNVIKNWYEVCKLEEFKITKDDFKGLSKGKWHINGESIDKIIAGNKIALRYIEDNNGNFDYFLRQNDGTVYYVKGWSGVNGLYQISKMDVS